MPKTNSDKNGIATMNCYESWLGIKIRCGAWWKGANQRCESNHLFQPTISPRNQKSHYL